MMCWYGLWKSTIFSWAFINVITFVTLSHSQSTTSHPQGHCSSYLNRYTSQEQCVYSFIVPKKDKDQCPGLAAEVDDLKEQMKQMQRWKEGIDRNILLLSNSKEDNRRLGIAEARAQMWTERFNNLTAENNRLRDHKSRLEIELSQNTINAQEAKAQLEEISKVQFPLQQNYTRLRTAYFALERRLGELQAQYDRLEGEYKEVKTAKNCSDVNKHLPSCAIIKQWGYTKSGDAMIDPDGEGGVNPFLVYCDMDSDPTTGITIIKHGNQPKYPVSNCEEAGCFSLPVQYEATLEQIKTLMSISLACEQFIRYDCFDSKLLKDNTAWWVSSRGEKMRYWGGASPGSNKCACGMDNTCVPTTEVCNCDADKEEWAFDEGMLRDRSTLPVVNLNFGDVNDAAGERGNVTLGPLKCKWNINMSVPSCDALLQAGVTGTGFFMVDEDGRGPLPPRRTLCNLPDFVTISERTRTNLQEPGIDIPATRNPNEYIFTSCGKDENHQGPTERQCNGTYQDTNVRITVRDGTQIWMVPKTGRYRIRAMAPSGFHLEPEKRGRGADMQAEFILEKSTEIRIIIGQRGNRHAGSGGTFIIRMFETYTSQPLLIAGAGGSSNSRRGDATTLDASKNENAKDSSGVGQNFGAGGRDGNGGYRGGARTGPNTAGGGAGFKTDGEKSSDDRFIPLPTKAIKANTNGIGNLAAGVGGTYTYITSSGVKRALHGGFGGGGSASKNGPGGGGGYSGGGGGPANGFSGGGGSYVRATEATGYTFQYNSNPHGGARIIYLGVAPGQTDKENKF